MTYEEQKKSTYENITREYMEKGYITFNGHEGGYDKLSEYDKSQAHIMAISRNFPDSTYQDALTVNTRLYAIRIIDGMFRGINTFEEFEELKKWISNEEIRITKKPV